MNQILYVGKHTLTTAVSRHFHSSWELIYCTGGNGELIFEDRILRYEENDIVIIPPFLPHSNVSEAGFTNIHINIDNTSLTGNEPKLVSADPNGFLLNAFAAAFYYYSSPSDGTSLLPIYGQLIAAFLTTVQPNSQNNGIVQEILNSILQNFPDSGYDLNAYLHTLPFNSEYLKKLFKKETGMTPLQYLTDKRLENAAKILAMNCDKGSISEASRLSGFGDPLYFSRLFKKKYGVSPRNYQAPEKADRVTSSDVMKTIL